MKTVSKLEISKNNVPDLKELLETKYKEKVNIDNVKSNPDLILYKKSKFYMNGPLLREHIATYKNYAILLKQEKLKEDITGGKEINLFPSIIKLEELKELKKVNGNIIRKMQPLTLNYFEKMALIMKTMDVIDTL